MAQNVQNLQSGDVAVFVDGKNKNVFGVLSLVAPFRTTFGGRIDVDNIWTQVDGIYYRVRSLIGASNLDFGITNAVRVECETDVLDNLNDKIDESRYEIIKESATAKYPFENPELYIRLNGEIVGIEKEDLIEIMKDFEMTEIEVYRRSSISIKDLEG